MPAALKSVGVWLAGEMYDNAGLTEGVHPRGHHVRMYGRAKDFIIAENIWAPRMFLPEEARPEERGTRAVRLERRLMAVSANSFSGMCIIPYPVVYNWRSI